MIRGLEHLCSEAENMLRELGFSAWRRLWGDFIAALRYLQGAHKKEGEGLFIQTDRDRRRGRNVLN